MSKGRYCGVCDCEHCGAGMQEYARTNSGRIIYRCPDCCRMQFADGSFVPYDLRFTRIEEKP